MAEVTCDNKRCNKKFEIKPRKKKHTVSIVETYFLCPHCKTRYSSHVTDQDIRKRQREIRTLNAELLEVAKDLVAEKINDEQYSAMLDKVDAKKYELKVLVDTLKAKVAPK